MKNYGIWQFYKQFNIFKVFLVNLNLNQIKLIFAANMALLLQLLLYRLFKTFDHSWQF